MATLDLRGSTGTLRLAKNGGSATVKSFVIVGAQGATGATGSTGPAGPTGPTGPSGPALPADQIASLSASFAKAPVPALELVTMTAFGNSWANGGNGSTSGARYWDRIASRNRTKPITNLGVSGTQSDEILARIIANWTPNQQGLVGLGDIVLNDLRHWNTDTDRVTTRECFRSMLARLNSWTVQDTTSPSLVYGPGWTNGVSDGVSGRYVDIAWTGPVVNIRVGCVTTAGATVTVKDTSTGSTKTTFATGGFKTPFEGVIRLTGYSSGAHTVRVSVDAAATIAGAIVPMPNPPLVVWFKAGPVTEKGAINPARTALYLSECASILSGYTNVLPVDVGSDWDDASMVYQTDGLHPNDKGHAYIADRIQSALLAQGFTQGLNSLAGVDAGTYTAPAPAYVGPGATAPSQVTGLTATTSNQARLTWTRAADGGATLTGYTIESSPAGAGTWTTLATAAGGATAYTVSTGLTQGSSYDFRVKATNSVGTGTASTTATATAGAAPSTYSADNFDRADGPIGVTSTGSFAYTDTNGTSTISGSRANFTASAANATGLINDGQANGTWSIDVLSSGTLQTGLIIRATGNTDGLVVWHSTDGIWKLARRTSATAYTQVITSAVIGTAADTIKIIANGSAVEVFINGVSIGTYTDTLTAANTRHGFWKSATTGVSVFDNYSHTSLTS